MLPNLTYAQWQGTTAVEFASSYVYNWEKEFRICETPHWSILQEHATYFDFPGFPAVTVLYHHLREAEVHTWYPEPWTVGYQSPLLSPVHVEKRTHGYLACTLLPLNLEMGQSRGTTKTTEARENAYLANETTRLRLKNLRMGLDLLRNSLKRTSLS